MNTEIALTELAHHDHHDAGWWWIGGIFQFLLLALIIVLIVRLVLWRRHGWYRHQWGHYGVPPTPTPHQILAERYAKGEINTEEYHERLRELNQQPPPPSA
jgi:putative membrane protein